MIFHDNIAKASIEVLRESLLPDSYDSNRISKKIIRIHATDLIYKWILGFKCDLTILILVLLNLMMQVIWLSKDSNNQKVNISNYILFLSFLF